MIVVNNFIFNASRTVENISLKFFLLNFTHVSGEMKVTTKIENVESFQKLCPCFFRLKNKIYFEMNK